MEKVIVMETLTDWINLISSKEKTFKLNDITVTIFGESDDSYMIIEKTESISPRKVTQYVIHPHETNNQLFNLLAFLSESKFNLLTLIKKLETTEFKTDEFNEILNLGSTEIARYNLIEN